SRFGGPTVRAGATACRFVLLVRSLRTTNPSKPLGCRSRRRVAPPATKEDSDVRTCRQGHVRGHRGRSKKSDRAGGTWAVTGPGVGKRILGKKRGRGSGDDHLRIGGRRQEDDRQSRASIP